VIADIAVIGKRDMQPYWGLGFAPRIILALRPSADSWVDWVTLGGIG